MQESAANRIYPAVALCLSIVWIAAGAASAGLIVFYTYIAILFDDNGTPLSKIIETALAFFGYSLSWFIGGIIPLIYRTRPWAKWFFVHPLIITLICILIVWRWHS
jgi:hypothetical protein